MIATTATMVFDWDKAARLIVERKPFSARAGLSQCWERTGGIIWEDGRPIPKDDTYVYLSSFWATPELDLDGAIVDCYVMKNETSSWNAYTYWPDSACAILAGLAK